jgi:tetratricopeptide (TPR) repeat protein
VVAPLALVLAAGLGFTFLAEARRTAGAFGLPLDDAWIHLGYARTLAETGRFAFTETSPPAQGSTSPLFTLLLAFVWPFIPDEKFLAYGAGMAAQGMFLAMLVPWAMHRFRSLAWGAAVALLVAFDGRTILISVSGMETSLFLAAVAAVFVSRAEGRWLVASALAGVSAWIRPEGLILAAIAVVDGLLPGGSWEDGERRRAAIAPSRRTLGRMAAVSLVGISSWVAFNAIVGGDPLPNTFAAKTAFYAGNSRVDFLRDDLAAPLLRGGWLLLLPGALWAFGREVHLLLLRRGGILRAEAGWVAAVPLAYLLLLPFGHRFARYMLPILPAFAILGVAGTRDLARWILPARPAPLAWIAVAIAFALQAVGLPEARGEYATFCDYHVDRHEKAGRWLAANVPPGAVVATHDVGAIGFYARRAIVDTVGVVEPLPASILAGGGDRGALAEWLNARGVTHVAALRNWLEVSNVAPLFVADPRPEILEVYPWIPGRSHLVDPLASRLAGQAADGLARGEAPEARVLLERSLAIDGANGRAWLLLGGALEMEKRLDEAEKAYRRALALEPDSDAVRFRLAANVAARGGREEARALAEDLLTRHPSDERLLAFYRTLGAR